MIVIADTTPLNYLVLIGQADLLAKLFGGVIVPPSVFEELQHARTPEAIRRWAAQRPSWLSVVVLTKDLGAGLSHLDKGNGRRLP